MGCCNNCIDNKDGSFTCLGLDHPDCRMNARVPANDFDMIVSIEIIKGETEDQAGID